MVCSSATAAFCYSEFTTDIQHVAGKNNIVADCLSRAHVATVHLGVDYSALAEDQLTDNDIQALRAADSESSLRLEDVVFTIVAQPFSAMSRLAYHARWSPLVGVNTVRVPGEFLACTTGPGSGEASSAAEWGGAKVFAPVAAHHCLPQFYVPSDLRSAKFVFVRHDAHRSPLQPPYDGPFRVLESGHKTFVVEKGTCKEQISVDRLKPAHVLREDNVQLACPAPRGRPPVAVRAGIGIPAPSSPPKVMRRSRRGLEPAESVTRVSNISLETTEEDLVVHSVKRS
ncbi:hypothetical protein WMY93_018247 [Mugilogobius chulae]|uniref:Integrase zinc-binding domain-containing protein n=1 Tax=Mugilogobius chulae TaxID=88201 RepID=A0AAW0NL19_9GOBI